MMSIAVVKVISRETSTKNNLRKLLYTDDLTVVVDCEADFQEWLVELKAISGREYSCTAKRRHGNGNSQENTNWGESVEESGWGDCRKIICILETQRKGA